LAGHWALVSDDEQDEDWMVVERDDGLSVTFVRQSALETDPATVATEVMQQALDSFRPVPGPRGRAAA
jgi:hypothetical protein